MTPASATTDSLNVLSGDTVSLRENRGAVCAESYFKYLLLGKFVHSVEFATDPARLETASSLAMPNVPCSGDPLKVFDAVIVTHGVDVVDLLLGAGGSKKRCSYETVEEKQSRYSITQIGAQVSIASPPRLLYEPTHFRALPGNIASQLAVSGDGITVFIADDGQPVGVFHG